MSQFDSYSKADYVNKLRMFLGKPRKGFLTEYGLRAETPTEAPTGRPPVYPEESLQALEEAVNVKAQWAEESERTFSERLCVAKDYAHVTDVAVVNALQIPARTLTQWLKGHAMPDMSHVVQLAELFHVPVVWLAEGGEHNLTADTHIGVRVGAESLMYKENLYAKTIGLLADIPEDADVAYAQAFIEKAISQSKTLKYMARRAGGRWQVANGTLVFAPWIPLENRGLTRRIWSDDVEAVITEELSSKPTVYGAWGEIRNRCLAMGLTEKDFPTKIALYKRVEKEKERTEKFGINLNEAIKASVAKYALAH